MWKRLNIVLAVLLAVGLAANGYLAWHLTSQADFFRNRAALLKNSLAALDGSAPQPASGTGGGSGAGASVVASTQPVVVRVEVTGDDSRPGSGVIVDRRGYVITNRHIIASADSIRIITMDGDSYDARVIARESRRDLALLKMDTSRSDFPEASLGTANDIVIGGDVIVGGFPLGDELSGPAVFSRGIISAVRYISGMVFIQTDAAINSGSGGGCMVNLDGRVIGIVAARVERQDGDTQAINLAIPVDEVLPFLQTFVK